MKNLYIKDLREGQNVDDVFLLRSKSLRDYASGKPGKYLQMEVGDKSGSIAAKRWDEAEITFEQITEGDLVRIMGKLSVYRGSPQIIVDQIQSAKNKDLDLADFIPASPKDIGEMSAELEKIIKEIKDPHLSRLLELFFKDADFASGFKSAPAGKSWHQAYLGGLLEHTLNVVKICRFIKELYPEIDQDLITAGAVLHDIGKIQELRFQPVFDYTDAGRLLGHISLEDAWIAEKISKIKDFPEELQLQLRHLVLSHHGQREKGSPVVPKTLEAVVLHFADNLDANAAGFTEIIKKTRAQGKAWSEFIQLIDTYVYAGRGETGETAAD
jgi:3'-5' exoribonuclease